MLDPTSGSDLGKMRAQWALVTCLLAAGACESTLPDADTPIVGTDSFRDVFAVVSDVRLAETDSTLVVDPTIRWDPEGGLLVADRGASQIRHYRQDGAHSWSYESQVGGTPAFDNPNVAVRLNSGEILAVDSHERMAVLAAEGNEIVRQLPYPFPSVDDADVLGSGSVLLSTRVSIMPQRDARNALHIVHVEGGPPLRSFFTPAVENLDAAVVQVMGWTAADVQGDTIAAIYALTDSVYLFALDGGRIAAIELPTDNFRPVQGTTPRGVPFVDWLQRFTAVSSVHWISRRQLVVQYQAWEHQLPRFRLLGMDLSGRRLFDIVDSPRLHFVDPERNFYFEDPAGSQPQRLIVARRSR